MKGACEEEWASVSAVCISKGLERAVGRKLGTIRPPIAVLSGHRLVLSLGSCKRLPVLICACVPVCDGT